MSGNFGFGPNPWQQSFWDWRAAGNFMCGGAGSGLIAYTALAQLAGPAAMLLVLGGLALVGLGLLCVWLEIGRPMRALNVFFNVRNSWMSREALVSILLFGLGLGLAAGVKGWGLPAAVAALAFLYCQSRIVNAARGIPAWRAPGTVPLLVTTGLAEGAGLFWLVMAWQWQGTKPLAVLFGALVLARALFWNGWRQGLATKAAPGALAAIDRSGVLLQWPGSALPLVLIALALTGLAGAGASAVLMAAAGLLVAASGALFKYTLITRAAFNQGFTLTRLPVRGAPRS